MENICILLADGFETIEALTPLDFIRRVGGKEAAILVSTTKNKIVKSAQGVKVETDILLDEVDAEIVSGVIVPGGIPGATSLRDNEAVINFIRILNDDNKLISSICAGPIVLEKAGIIKDKNVTSYPGFDKDLKSSNYKNDRIVVDGNIITARGPAIATDFSLEIVKRVFGKEKFEKLKEDILYNM